MSSSKPEKVEEKKFVAKVEAHGFDCPKLATVGPYGRVGRNDRIVLASYGITALFEFKRDGEDKQGVKTHQPEKIQDYYHEKLQKLRHHHYVVYTCDEAYSILMALVRKAKAAYERSGKESEALDSYYNETWDRPQSKA